MWNQKNHFESAWNRSENQESSDRRTRPGAGVSLAMIPQILVFQSLGSFIGLAKLTFQVAPLAIFGLPPGETYYVGTSSSIF